MSSENFKLAEKLGEILKEKSLKLVTAESCTGGLLAAFLTEVPGSSEWFDSGFITYSNEAKQRLLSVDQQTLDIHGAVSEACALEMSKGALSNDGCANISVSITGIAGPSGGTKEKPVGTVWIAFAHKKDTIEAKATLFNFKGSRKKVRLQSVNKSLTGLIDLAKKL